MTKELEARYLQSRLCIVGGNHDAAVEAQVKALFKDVETKGRVAFAGFRVGEELAAAYGSADLFLSCPATETTGLVVLESIASGVPVVARDVGESSDTVNDGETGSLSRQ